MNQLDSDPRLAWVLENCLGSVLDAGCGTGEIALEIAKSGFDVIAMDSNQISILQAQSDLQKVRAQISNRMVFMNCSIEECPLPEGSFDTVFAGDVFVDKDSMYILTYRLIQLLKIGGTLLVTVPFESFPSDDLIFIQEELASVYPSTRVGVLKDGQGWYTLSLKKIK